MAEKEVCMTKKDFVEEHTDLPKILKRGSRKERTREAIKQSRELKRETGRK